MAAETETFRVPFHKLPKKYHAYCVSHLSLSYSEDFTISIRDERYLRVRVANWWRKFIFWLHRNDKKHNVPTPFRDVFYAGGTIPSEIVRRMPFPNEKHEPQGQAIFREYYIENYASNNLHQLARSTALALIHILREEKRAEGKSAGKEKQNEKGQTKNRRGIRGV